mgnify:CR=1 FL=1
MLRGIFSYQRLIWSMSYWDVMHENRYIGGVFGESVMREEYLGKV